ncbi:MAG: hypothetical protein ACI90V_005779, partial [Bacillariaceae sp.]
MLLLDELPVARDQEQQERLLVVVVFLHCALETAQYVVVVGVNVLPSPLTHHLHRACI